MPMAALDVQRHDSARAQRGLNVKIVSIFCCKTNLALIGISMRLICRPRTGRPDPKTTPPRSFLAGCTWPNAYDYTYSAEDADHRLYGSSCTVERGIFMLCVNTSANGSWRVLPGVRCTTFTG